MSITIICNNKDPEPWATAIREILPTTEIQVYPYIKSFENVDFAICWKPEKDVLSKFVNLKAVQSLGASVEHIFDTNILKPDVQVARIIDPQLSQDMFEFLLAITMNHLRGIESYLKLKAIMKWEQKPYQNINSTCVTILGAGKIGGHVASEFGKLGFIVNTWSESKVNLPFVNSIIGKNSLIEILPKTDILINLLPLTSKTYGLLDKKLLQNIKKRSYLINVGRGPHIVDNDLLQLLDSGQLSGAFLDVFCEEPLPENHKFWKHPKINITPHVASLTNVSTAVKQIVENYLRLKKGKPLNNQVSHEKGY